MAAAAARAEAAVGGRRDGGATASRDIESATNLCLVKQAPLFPWEVLHQEQFNSTTFPAAPWIDDMQSLMCLSLSLSHAYGFLLLRVRTLCMVELWTLIIFCNVNYLIINIEHSAAWSTSNILSIVYLFFVFFFNMILKKKRVN